MRGFFVAAAGAVFMIAANTASPAAMREVPYQAVKVELSKVYVPDAAFENMQKSFAEAAAKEDTQALFALVGPTFVWMSQGEISNQFDFGRSGLHNFKVVFGFRESGKDSDEAVTDGPFWPSLATFAADKTYYTAADTLVCGPIAATVVDDNGLDAARQKIGADDSVEWYFTVAEVTTVTASPTDASPVGRVGRVALPVMSVYPPTPEKQSGPTVTHLQVLIPSGKNGWIPISAVSPLVADRLCYALSPDGTWKIAGFDQAP